MTKKIQKILEKNKIIQLDIGCGENKQQNFIGIDKRKLPSVDIIHDLEVFPYPLPAGVATTILGSHIVEHIKPWLMIDFMNELWRLLKVGGKIIFALPYSNNHLFVQDPTHCNPCSEVTWKYFTPTESLYNIYKPRPFVIESCTWQSIGTMEVLLRKINDKEAIELYKKMMLERHNIKVDSILNIKTTKSRSKK